MNETDTTGTVVACRVGEIEDGACRRLDTRPAVALYRFGDAYYATADSCTHEEWSLGDEGELDGHRVTCTLHMAEFDVRDGRALCLPATLGLRTYPVQVVGDEVWVQLC